MKKVMMAFLVLVFSVPSQAAEVCYTNFKRLSEMIPGVISETCAGGWVSLEDGVPFSPVKLVLAYRELAGKIKKAGDGVKGSGKLYDLDGDQDIYRSAERVLALRKMVLKDRIGSINQIPADMVCSIGYIDELNSLYSKSHVRLNGYCRHDLAEFARLCTDPDENTRGVCGFGENYYFSHFMDVVMGKDPYFETGGVDAAQRFDEKTALKKWKATGMSWVKLHPFNADSSTQVSSRIAPQPEVSRSQVNSEQATSNSSGGGFWSALGTFVGALSGAAEAYNNSQASGVVQNNQYVAPAPQVRNNDMQRQQICNSCQIRKAHACNQVDQSAHPSPAMRMDCAHSCFNECK